MDNMTYEQAMKKLQKIVEQLEKGDLSLDKTVELYDEASKLSGYCSALLSKAKLKITELTGKDVNE